MQIDTIYVVIIAVLFVVLIVSKLVKHRWKALKFAAAAGAVYVLVMHWDAWATWLIHTLIPLAIILFLVSAIWGDRVKKAWSTVKKLPGEIKRQWEATAHSGGSGTP